MFWVDRDPFVWPAGVQRSDMCDFCVVSPQEMGMPFLSPGCTAWNVAIAVRTGAVGGAVNRSCRLRMMEKWDRKSGSLSTSSSHSSLAQDRDKFPSC